MQKQTLHINELALQIAIGQLGVEEVPKGSNKGAAVEEYLHSVGLDGGYAWCQAFVHWCYEQAAKQLGLPCPVVKTAGVLDCWNRTDVGIKHVLNDCVHHPDIIKPGAQFIMNFGHGKGHTGIVERVEGLILHTIEGNSNNDGSREGYAVVRHKRSLGDIKIKGLIIYS